MSAEGRKWDGMKWHSKWVTMEELQKLFPAPSPLAKSWGIDEHAGEMDGDGLVSYPRGEK